MSHKMYNFDEIIPRGGTSCLKFDDLKARYGREDLQALWVADMDFRTPDFILEALRSRLDHPILGYPKTGEDYFEVVSKWVEWLHGWQVDPKDFIFIPGIVKGIGLAQRCFLKPGDKVVIQPPVYHPFRSVTLACGFEVVDNPLKPVYDEDGFLSDYEMDLEGLEKAIDEKTKMLILSNPHNPGGVCFSVEQLRSLAHICASHGITVISDEIHAEMLIGGRKHHPFATVSEEAADCSVTFMAPSKTFNIAGVVSSYSIILNSKLRRRFFSFVESMELDYPCIFSAVATRAAYTEKGKAWRAEMLAYVEKNIDFVDAFLRERIPQIRAVRPQASFLMWLDCRKLGLGQDSLEDLFVDKAHLALNEGSMFGSEGTGFMRLNIGCPKSVLGEALEGLEKAVKTL